MTGHNRAAAEAEAPVKPQGFAVPREYLSLHKYLANRFADTVVLTFAEIEDLLGFTLPDLARLRHEWWANADSGSAPSVHSRSWPILKSKGYFHRRLLQQMSVFAFQQAFCFWRQVAWCG